MDIKRIYKLKQLIEYFNESDIESIDVISGLNKIRAYFDDENLFKNIKCCLSDNCSLEEKRKDISIIIEYLQGKMDNIPNISLIEKIIDVCDRINKIKDDDYSTMLAIVREIYTTFSSCIQFDDNIKKLSSIPTANGREAKFVCALDINVIKGLKNKLEILINDLLNPKTIENTNPSVLINNNNFNNQSLNNTNDIDIVIKNVIKNVDDSCFSNEEEKLLKEMIDKLDDLIKSNEKKNVKWQKFKEIVSGIANFSLKAAEIIAPLIIQVWPKQN